MFHRGRRRSPGPGPLPELPAFLATVARVEAAKESLVAAAPGGRPSPISLAEALAGFEAGLAAASRSLPGWRSARTESAWIACRGALDEAASRAERLRLEGSPQGYEELVEVLDELLRPLEAFRGAVDDLRGRGA